MSLALASLGSGSRGNALLIEADTTLVMVDCGFSTVEVKRRLAVLGKRPEDLDGLLVTHEHNDHIAGAARLSRRYQLPVWLTHGTYANAPDQDFFSVRFLNSHSPLKIEALDIEPLPVPHDAREPAQFIFGHRDRRVATITDLGHVTPHILDRVRGCDGVAVEFNHDLNQLAEGPYPEPVKVRVSGPLGHLNNTQAANLVAETLNPRLQWILGLHVSAKNNSQDSVRSSLAECAADALQRFDIASQEEPSGWYRID